MNIKEEKYLKNLNHIASNIAIYDVVVDNIDDALEVAMKFKENDEYDWFRGQSGLWPLISTFNRLSVDEQKTMLKKISLLQHWANETLNLQNEDKIIAIAQHYGIPTNFIDFSTDPKTAAFFASNTSDNNSEPNEYSCIICINTQVVSNIIEISKNTTFKNRPHPELLSINVDNLWHLDAQKGKFLYLPMVGFELSLPFKRIIFKRSKQNGSKFVRTDYIPERRSSLEQRFYGYIQMRILSDTTELLEEFVSQVTDMPLIKDEGFDYYKDFVDEQVLLSFKWNKETNDMWKNLKIEKYESVNNNREIFLVLGKDEEHYEIEVYVKILNQLEKDLSLRSFLISWNIDSNDNNSIFDYYSDYANQIWDGMRNLPYTNKDIASVMSKLMTYLKLKLHIESSGQRSEVQRFFKHDIEHIIPDNIEVIVNNKISNFNKAFVSKKLLKEAMRDDLNIVFKERNIEDINSIMYYIKKADLLYKFEDLKDLFVDSIILTQLFSYDKKFIIYSPADINWLTIP